MMIDVFLPPRGRQGRSNREVCLYHGMGCHLHDNCFTCTFNPYSCKYKSNGSGSGNLWVFFDGENYYREREEMG